MTNILFMIQCLRKGQADKCGINDVFREKPFHIFSPCLKKQKRVVINAMRLLTSTVQRAVKDYKNQNQNQKKRTTI